MAKPTTENLTLPDFPVTLVRVLEGNIIHEDINLQERLAHSDKGLILYFHPKDNTSGCTTQATDFTTHLHDFAALGYDIIGVSRDGIESHKKFIEKHHLAIPLISDGNEQLCQYFGVIKEKNMYGKITLGLVRSSFVFDSTGHLTHAQRNLRAKDYATRLLTILGA